ncbi:MBL fold metallo-hydrolase [Sagittula sp. S175]|uniref:MBL fold metallo-hydrolase n=1 Tax=Sagittula sp. S175 TaxID=3415129 RepID=UPI003C7C59B4
MQDPQPDFQPQTGLPEELEPGLRRIVAPNPSPMTLRGTNSYVIGEGGGLAVIDPGPQDETHLQVLLDAVRADEHISHILVTHAHLDHSPLARTLSKRTGAPVYGFGAADAGRSALMRQFASSGHLGGGEGVDKDFVPDVLLADRDVIHGDSWTITALHTPGHMANHLAFALGHTLFSGDLVMGWATSLVSPPDGDLTAFMTSLRGLQAQDWRRFHPGHGAPVEEPARRVADLIAHRLGREASILHALAQGDASASDLATKIYTETPPALLPAATRNVLAHLLDLTERAKVTPVGMLSSTARFSLASRV